MKHIKIGVDMDDVLMDFNQQLILYHNRIYGTTFSKTDLTTYHLDELFKCTKEESIKIVDEFYKSHEHTFAPPIAGAIECINTLKKYTLILISARPEQVRSITEEWLAKYFRDAFSQIYLTGEYRKSKDQIQTKGEIAYALGIQLFLEDSMSNAINISSQNIPVILFDTPWNQGVLPEKITRANSWIEALQLTEKILKQN